MGDNANFLYEIINRHIAEGKYTPEQIHTRFPPEPNGYLHIGNAKAIYINWSIARRYGGKFNLRYDDTNPTKESDEFVRAIEEDLRWLEAEPDGGIFFGSDYFDACYEFAKKLIKDGKAYVCDLSGEELREYRGDYNTEGRPSPYRDRSVEENLDLFERMKNGEFPDGSKTLRAKIDVNSPNILMRDPALFRIRHASHHRQGNKWCIYPLYDYAHPIQDALEGITHSCCSDEFIVHRPLYDWVCENIGFDPRPYQYEFGRMDVTYTVMSKRYLRRLVEEGRVDGWDDPRLPTICALRRRGYTPSAIFEFIRRAGIDRNRATIDINLLEYCIREELGATAERRIAVIEPLKVVITNYPENKTEYFELPNNPTNPDAGVRSVPFTRELWIEKSDFAEVPPPKFFRLKPGWEVRLMGAYIIRCNDVIKNEKGEIVELRCEADLATGCGMPKDGRKIKGTIHWVSVKHAVTANVIYYDHLFTIPNINEVDPSEYDAYLNPDSMKKYTGCMLEPSLSEDRGGVRYQFVRNGYFIKDTKNENTYNRIVSLKASYKPQA